MSNIAHCTYIISSRFYFFCKNPTCDEKSKSKRWTQCNVSKYAVSVNRQGVKMIVAKKLRQQCQIFNIAIFPSRCLLRAVVEFGLTSNSNCQEGGEQQDLTQIMLPFQQKLKRVWSTLHRSTMYSIFSHCLVEKVIWEMHSDHSYITQAHFYGFIPS